MNAAGTHPSLPPAATRLHAALLGWIERNVTRCGEPKQSGDDCHETIAAQLDYFRQAGLIAADCPWQTNLWGLLRGLEG